MDTTLDIKSIQYMNLFSFMTGLKAMDCFEYGPSIVFVVQNQLVKNIFCDRGERIRRFGERVKKNVKIVELPANKNGQSMQKFILSVTYPVKFKKLSITNNEVTINAAPEIKARLIGRGSIRLNELNHIVKKYFEVKRILIR